MTTIKRFLGLMVLALSPNLSASAAATGGWHVLAGPSFSDISVPVGSGEKERRLGFLAGAGYEAPVGRNASLLVRVLFKTGGTHVDSSPTSDMTYAGSALAIPVLFKLRLGGGSAPFVLAGGYAAFLFSARVEVESAEAGTETHIPLRDVNAFVYGLSAGAGYEIDLGRQSLFVEAFYLFGLSNLAKTGSADVRPNSVNLAVGFRF